MKAAFATVTLTEKEFLGKLLYQDQNLSQHKNQSCFTCHSSPGFADARFQNVVSAGSNPQLHGGRNAPSSAYASYSPAFHWNQEDETFVGGQFWDGRANTLAEQAKMPLLNPVEMGMKNKESVLQAINDPQNKNYTQYRKLFKKVYGTSLKDWEKNITTFVEKNYDNLADAIATYEKSKELNPFHSKFDLYLAGETKLTEQELRGLQLFNGKGRCSSCHTSEASIDASGKITPPLFTDFTYDNIGIPKNNHPLLKNNPIDLGLGAREGLKEQAGKFKVPTLRNIGLTAPYGHNGYFATLKDIVHFYNTRDDGTWPAPEVMENLNKDELGNLGLTDQEENDLVQFLHTLSDLK